MKNKNLISLSSRLSPQSILSRYTPGVEATIAQVDRFSDFLEPPCVIMLIYGNESLSHLVEELHLVLVLVDLGVETLEGMLYEVSFTHADSATSLLYLLKIV